MSELRLYDSTRLNDAKDCLRKFYYRHVMHFVPEGTSTALAFGASWHAAMDSLWPRHKELYASKAAKTDVINSAYSAFVTEWVVQGMAHPDEMSPDQSDDLGARTPINALEMLHEYGAAREHVFNSPSFELLAVEEPFIIPLDPNNTTRFYCGRLDKRVRWQRKISVFEHKTTTLYRVSGIFSSDWIDSFSLNPQVDGYNLSLHMRFGDEAGGTFVDGALVHKRIHDGFKLLPVDKQMDQLDAFLYDTHTWIDQIEANLEVLEERSKLDTPYLAAFPRNTKSCVSTYGRCPYFDLCRVTANPAKLEGTPLGFKIEPWLPVERLGLEKIISEVGSETTVV